MKGIARELTLKEIVIAIVLAVVILGMIYVLVVDRPIRKEMADINATRQELAPKVEEIDAKVAALDNMKAELDAIESKGTKVAPMPSYNANKNEVDFMHNTLSDTLDYYVGFNEVTRDGDQIRRGFSIKYKISSYSKAMQVLKKLESSSIRCLIGDISVTPIGDNKDIMKGAVQVSCSATFFETMYGGKEDEQLPEDEAKSEAEE